MQIMMRPDGSPYRKPDSHYRDQWAVWYGPGGPEGECATELGKVQGGYAVSEYRCMVGRLDEEEPFLRITAWVSDEEASAARRAWNPRSRLPLPQFAARIGVNRIGENGGEETFVADLPK